MQKFDGRLMKNLLFLFFWMVLFEPTQSHASVVVSETDCTIILQEMRTEMKQIQERFDVASETIHRSLAYNHQALLRETVLENKVQLLLEKEVLQLQWQQLQSNTNAEISKVRYIKGLQIVKILYEKVLGLDHHFASVRTFAEISKIANPNQYPEFEKMKELVATKKEKKAGFDIGSILGTNPYVAVISTFSNLLVSNLSKEEKEQELQKIDCLLDFTMRMQNDLNTIYFETAYLQSSNQTIKNNLEQLFKEYTKPINYSRGLKECRNEDDWDAVSSQLNTYLDSMKKCTPTKQLRLQIDIEFPIDRLLQFINHYNDFINEGGRFYQKFNTILNSYENEKQCETKLPIAYKKMKEDIAIAIEKFNVAYKPVEINGSKMKEILYGINEFE